MKILIYDAGRRKDIETGYGVVAFQFGERLKGHGNEVFYFDERNHPADIDLWLWIRPPHYVKYKEFDPENVNVFYTMHEHEALQGWKAGWPRLLNKCDAVITPTEWNKEVWANNGVTVPIHVVPMGVDSKIFRGCRTYEFSLLSVFEGLGVDGSREYWREDIEAYFDVFHDNHHLEVSYTIKSWTTDWGGYQRFLRKLMGAKKYDPLRLPTVNVIEHKLIPVGMNALYAKHWAFLKNSRGEGWCLPAIEAMATGMRIISRPLPTMVYLTEKNCDFFDTPDELREMIWENWRRYRKWKLHINQWHWKKAVCDLHKALEEILEHAKVAV